MTGMGYCELCATEVPTLELLVHITVHHAAFSEPVLTWPDGKPVVIDTTLEPEDFIDERHAELRAMVLATPTRWERFRARLKALLRLP